ncbi:hypothetical protein Tco_0989213 [Tanacetum coccineum]|uniref:Uncharacterized protein n=1 Tax=Tanacetum coccineum TaxID=301880 RepID=A0ABQ5ETI2_9ASTR
MSTPKFAETHNLVAFLEKPEESSGFEEIIDFLNASYVQYALTVNPTIYTTCIEQFWASSKAKILDDAEGIDCLPTASIFAELERMGAKTTAWNEFCSTMAFAIICLATNQTFNFSKYIFNNMVKHLEAPSHTKKVFANIKRQGKGFSGRVTPLFPTMMIQALEDMGEDLAVPSDSHSTPIISQPSSSKPQNKKSRRKQRKDSGPTKPVTDEAHVSTPSYDLPQSGEDSMQLSELMNLCTSLQEKVLDLEKAKTAQAKDIASLKKRGRKIADLDADAEVTLVDENQEMNEDNLMFDTFNPVSVADPVTQLVEVVNLLASASVEIPDELTLAQTLIEIKTAKPKPVTTVTSVRPRAKGIIFHDQETNQVALDEEMARNLKANAIELKKKESLQGKRAEEDKRKPPTKLENRNQIKLYDKEMKRVNTFVDMNSEVVKEAEKDDDPEEEEMKKHMEIVQDEEEIAIDAIPLATKPLMIVEYKIVKEGQKGFYHLNKKHVLRERIKRLRKLVIEKHGINRPVDEYERVLLDDMKLQLLSDYYCWKDYADRYEIKGLSEKR